ncbi:hypothetical protein V8E36_001533 [Tilletia maclaganii]
MSVELDWQLLDDVFAQSVLAAINRTIAGAKKPAFLGSVVATSLDFGSDKPETEVCHIGDIDTLFLDRTDRDRAAALAGGLPPAAATASSRDEVRDAVSIAPDAHELHRSAGPLPHLTGARGIPPANRRQDQPRIAHEGRDDMLRSQHRPRLNGRLDSSYLGSPLNSGSVLGGIGGYASGMRTPSGPGLNNQLSSWWQPQAVIIAAAMRAQALDREAVRHIPAPPTRQPSLADMRMRLPVSDFPSPLDEQDDPTKTRAPGNTATVAPTLQIHLRTRWRSTTVRCKIQTSLVINYPSPQFMSLDLNLSLVGLVFDGVIVLAIEGEKRKMHISILEHEDDLEGDEEDDEDDFEDQEGVPVTQHGPTAGQAQSIPRLSRSITTLSGLPLPPQDADTTSPPPHQKPRPLLPPDPDLSPIASRKALPALGNGDAASLRTMPPPPPLRTQSAHAYLPSTFFHPPIPTTPGTRLLPSLTFESSVGDEHKHVLKNVGKVEKFVQDMIRKAIEDQLLFPNFKTVDLRKGTNKK